MSGGTRNKLTGYHNRQSIRLPGHDYSCPGAYFVTVCIRDRKQRLFGDVNDGEMGENELAGIVRKSWCDLPCRYPQIKLDEFIIMPNHVHGIIIIRDSVVGAGLSRPNECQPSDVSGSSRPNEKQPSGPDQSKIVGARLSRPDEKQSETGEHDDPASRFHDNPNGRDDQVGRDNRAPTLGNIVAYFKYQTTKQINDYRKSGITIIWQRNFYDHIARDERSLYLIRRYIRDNPAKWGIDTENHLTDEINQYHAA